MTILIKSCAQGTITFRSTLCISHSLSTNDQVTLKAIKIVKVPKFCVCVSLLKLCRKRSLRMKFKDILDEFDGKVYKVLDRDGMPSVTCRSVQHCQQQSNWDCGLSCVLMALDAADLFDVKDTILENVEEICKSEGFGHSTWSIDLCYLIKHYAPQLRFSYTTITIGVDPSYMNQVSLSIFDSFDFGGMTGKFAKPVLYLTSFRLGVISLCLLIGL